MGDSVPLHNTHLRKVFVDTSAFYALVCETDRVHAAALAIHEHLKRDAAQLLTTNYVFLESVSLIQKRHGVDRTKQFGDFVSKHVEVMWITASQHRAAWDYWKQRGMRELSLVDCSCIAVMRECGIQRVFGFDDQFRTAGFTVLDVPPVPDRAAERRGSYRAEHAKRR